MIFQRQYQIELDRFKESFLMAAVKGGRIHEVSSLLDLGANVDGTNVVVDEEVSSSLLPAASSVIIVEDSPLFAAIRNGHVDVASLLLAHGANPKCETLNGRNRGLHLAAMTGMEEMCRLLLVAEVGNEDDSSDRCHFLLTCTNENNMTAFDIAVERGFLALAEKLKNGKGLMTSRPTNCSFEDESSEDFSSASNIDDLNYVEEIRDRFLALSGKTGGHVDSSVSESDNEAIHYSTLFHEEGGNNVSIALGDRVREGGIVQSDGESLSSHQDMENLGDVTPWDKGESIDSERKFPPLSSQISMESVTCEESEDEDVNFDLAQQSTSLESQLEPLRALVEHLHAKNIALEETEKVTQMLSEDTEKALLILETKCKNLEKEKDDAQRIIEETLDGANLSNKSFDDLEVIESRLRKALQELFSKRRSL